MGLRDRGIAPVIVDVLVAAEGIAFGPSGRSAGDEVCRLIVAETCENGILLEKLWSSRMSAVPSFNFRTGSIHVVVAGCIRIGCGVKLSHFAPRGLINAAGIMLQACRRLVDFHSRLPVQELLCRANTERMCRQKDSSD